MHIKTLKSGSYKEKKKHFIKMMICCYTELQIRRGKRDNLRILFWHFCIKHICLDSSLEPPNRDGFNEEFQHVSLQIGWLVVVILDVARCYLWLFTLYINIKISKNSC